MGKSGMFKAPNSDSKESKQFLAETGIEMDDAVVVDAGSIANKRTNLLDILVISQTGVPFQYWTLFLTIVCLVSCMMYAFFAAYRYDVEVTHGTSNGRQYVHFKDETIELFRRLVIVFELIQFVDFLIQFCLDYT
jgi:hypothetical protein